MKFKSSILISAAMAALIFVGCKPTEKNYKAAYDAAVAKRAVAAAEQMRPATGLLSDDGPALRIYDGDSVFVAREHLVPLDSAALRGHWAVAIGVFKMDTNAKASAAAIRSRGFRHALAAKTTGGRYYAIASSAATLDSARVSAKEFKAVFPDYPYIGLPGAPVLISF